MLRTSIQRALYASGSIRMRGCLGVNRGTAYSLLRGALMQGVICRLLQGRIKRGDGHESLNLPFPFFSKRRERKGGGLSGDRIRKKGAPAKNAGGRRVYFPRDFSSEAEPAQ